MVWKFVTATMALIAHHVSAQGMSNMLRFGCSQLVIERSDPLVNPGMNPSTHTHQIVGGNSFNFSMDPSTVDPARDSTCTTCTYAEDFSNYWTASIYFRSPENGTFKLVPQVANLRRPTGDELLPQDGGLTVYYMEPFGSANTITNSKTTAFRPGFRMLAGDPSLRSKKGTFQGICHRCNGNGEGGAPCDSKDSSEFPDRICPRGIRATVIFPTCWDGRNLDSPDHRSHMAYAPGGAALAGDKCPGSHPVRVPQVMYEIMYDTRGFNDKRYFEGGRQPFVYSFGDGTGHGQHGDYLFGWRDDSLQRALNELGKNGCQVDVCSSALKIQDGKDAIACTKASQVKENVGRGGDWLPVLPGNVAVTYK